ncbi:MAG TPA: hypothetical protein DEF47_18450 [Herpetosiphon sp.]|nr:hypothetical protein [Herpetosiphon sp.]
MVYRTNNDQHALTPNPLSRRRGEGEPLQQCSPRPPQWARGWGEGTESNEPLHLGSMFYALTLRLCAKSNPQSPTADPQPYVLCSMFYALRP